MRFLPSRCALDGAVKGGVWAGPGPRLLRSQGCTPPGSGAEGGRGALALAGLRTCPVPPGQPGHRRCCQRREMCAFCIPTRRPQAGRLCEEQQSPLSWQPGLRELTHLWDAFPGQPREAAGMGLRRALLSAPGGGGDVSSWDSGSPVSLRRDEAPGPSEPMCVGGARRPVRLGGAFGENVFKAQNSPAAWQGLLSLRGRYQVPVTEWQEWARPWGPGQGRRGPSSGSSWRAERCVSQGQSRFTATSSLRGLAEPLPGWASPVSHVAPRLLAWAARSWDTW